MEYRRQTEKLFKERAPAETKTSVERVGEGTRTSRSRGEDQLPSA